MSSVYSNYIKRMRMCANENCEGCTYQYEGLTNTEECKEDLLYDAAEQLEDADKCNAKLVKKSKEMEQRIAKLEDELRFQLDTRRKETAEIERLKAENLKLQKQNRDCGWNCKQCEYVDKDLQAEESEQRLIELDRRLYELRSFNARMRGEQK